MSPLDDATLDSGTVIGGRYRLRRPVGGGGMGVVYEAESIDLGRRCAVKLVRARGSLDAAARLKREAHAVAKLTHPNVVHVFDFVDDETLGPALVMELLTGEPLSGRLARKGALSVAEARAIFGQVLDGLGAAHDAGMIHRDIKPSNLFLVALAGGQVVAKVLDFGIVRWVAPRDELALTGSADWLGTPQYMAPEVLLHRPSDERADLYAVGCCLYQSLTGKPPFEGENAIAIAHDVVNGPGLALERLPASVPDSVRELIRVATHKDPDQRPATAAEMRAQLLSTDESPRATDTAADVARERAVSSEQSGVTAVGTTTGSTSSAARSSDRPWLILGAVGLFGALGLGAMISSGGGERERAPERAEDRAASEGEPMAEPTVAAPERTPTLALAPSPAASSPEDTDAVAMSPPSAPTPADARSEVPARDVEPAAPRRRQAPSAGPRGTAVSSAGASAPEGAPNGSGNATVSAPRLGEDIVDPYAPSPP